MKLYHGSRTGIHGDISPISRERCDFGRGFYMGTEKMQPLTLICDAPGAILYEVELATEGLNILNLQSDLDWAMLIAYNRGKMESAKGTDLYRQVSQMMNGYDVVVGDIANDRMFVVLDRFFNGIITDKALVASLSALRLGKKYVAITDKGCSKVRIIYSHVLTDEDRVSLQEQSLNNRSEGIRLADEIAKQYRREGRFFDEILKAGEANA
jgi:hypothetical protein